VATQRLGGSLYLPIYFPNIGLYPIYLSVYRVVFFLFMLRKTHYFCTRQSTTKGVDKDIMQTKILKVIKSGEMFSVKSEKSETGVLNKRNLMLKELGGKFENEYAVSVLGNAASLVFAEGDLVVVTLRFQTREYNGQVFQDITVTDIYPLKK